MWFVELVLCVKATNEVDWMIIGAGAIGSYYGGALVRAGRRVAFYETHAGAALRAEGLQWEHGKEHAHLHPLAIFETPSDIKPAHTWIVALKATQMELLKDLAVEVSPHPRRIILMQNGIGMEQGLAEQFPGSLIFGAACFAAITKTGPTSVSLQEGGLVSLGQYRVGDDTEPVSQELGELAAELTSGGWSVETHASLMRMRWSKLLWNIPFNGLSVLRDRRDVAGLLRDPESRTQIDTVGSELLRLANADQCPLPTELWKKMLAFTSGMKPYGTSMKSDYDQRRPLELDAFFKYPLTVARRHAVEIPCLRQLHQDLVRMDLENRGHSQVS